MLSYLIISETKSTTTTLSRVSSTEHSQNKARLNKHAALHVINHAMFIIIYGKASDWPKQRPSKLDRYQIDPRYVSQTMQTIQINPDRAEYVIN